MEDAITEKAHSLQPILLQRIKKLSDQMIWELPCIIGRISRFKIRDSIREHNSPPQVSIAKGVFQE